MKFLKNLFRRRMKITFVLKSGTTFSVRAHNITTKTRGGSGAEITGYELNGIVKGEVSVHYLRLEDVSAILVEH